MSAIARERDIREAIEGALVATNAFDLVAPDLPESYGFGASRLCAAVIDPVGSTLVTGWDAQDEGGLCYAGTCAVTLLARDEDPRSRDATAERLLDTLHNVVNGRSLADMTLPAKTLVTAWKWQTPAAPERRIVATVSFSYIVEGWDQRDVTI